MYKVISLNGTLDCVSTIVSGHHLQSTHKYSSDQSEDEADFNRMRRKKKWEWEWRKLLACILGFLMPVIFPTVHMFIFIKLWGYMKDPVDRNQCRCSCWDTVFKGPYESGVARYKHVYFNSDRNTLKMWIITVIFVILLYEVFKKFFFLLFQRRLRWSMGFLFLISLHSHYYSWWGYWGYWNDEFYRQWYHQLFFTLTELISSIIVLNYFDSRKPIKPIPMLIICSIAVFHALCSGWDQFIRNVLQGRGELHQLLRDITLMTTDILYATLSLNEVRNYAARRGVSLFSIMPLYCPQLYIISTVIVVMYCLSLILSIRL